MTRQRALILGIMREKCPEHLTADEIFSHARQAMPHIARGTVYRNLKLMELDGEIGHLEMPDGPDRYDANPTPTATCCVTAAATWPTCRWWD